MIGFAILDHIRSFRCGKYLKIIQLCHVMSTCGRIYRLRYGFLPEQFKSGDFVQKTSLPPST